MQLFFSKVSVDLYSSAVALQIEKTTKLMKLLNHDKVNEIRSWF